MFFIRWVRGLLAFPLHIVAGLVYTFSPPRGTPLVMAAWTVGRTPRTGMHAMLALYQRDGAAALSQGLSWAKRWPTAMLWSALGLLAMEARDLDMANQCLAEARQFPPDPDGMVDLLEYYTQVNGEKDQLTGSEDDLQPFLQRRDTSLLLSRQLVSERIWRAVFRRDLEAVERLSTHALEVEDLAPARMALGLTETLQGRPERAKVHFQRANFTGPDVAVQRLYFQIFVEAMLGNVEAVRGGLSQFDAMAPGKGTGIRRVAATLLPGHAFESPDAGPPPLPSELPPPLPPPLSSRPPPLPGQLPPPLPPLPRTGGRS